MVSNNFLSSNLKVTVENTPFFLIREFFDSDTLNKVSKEINRLSLSEDGWQKVNIQEHRPRKNFHGEDSELFKEIIEFLNTEEFLDSFFKLTEFKINKIDFHLWWDTEGYTIPMHVDNEAVKLSMQIYVGEQTHSFLGTSFGDNNQDPILTLPYLKNTGYFLPNPNTIQHGLISTVPENFNRFSLYFYMQ